MTEELKHAVAISSLLQLPSEQIFRLCALARISKSCGLIFAAIRKTRPVSASPVQKAWIEKDVPQCGRAHACRCYQLTGGAKKHRRVTSLPSLAQTE
jgi:hypothetical protein